MFSNKLKRGFIFSLLFILMLQFFIPLFSASKVYAETGTDEKPASEESKEDILVKGCKAPQKGVKIAKNGIASCLELYESNMSYSKELQIEITYRLLSQSPYANESYAALYTEDLGGNLGNYGLEGLKSKDAVNSSLKSKKGLYRVPLYDNKGKTIYLKEKNILSISTGQDGYIGNRDQEKKKSVRTLKGFHYHTNTVSPGSIYRELNNKIFAKEYKDNFVKKDDKQKPLYVDSYGNIITEQLDIVVPYWAVGDGSISEFLDGGMFSTSRSDDIPFMSFGAYTDTKTLGHKKLESVLSSHTNAGKRIREFEAAIDGSKNMDPALQKLFKNMAKYDEDKVTSTKLKYDLSPSFDTFLAEIFESDDLRRKLAEYIVNVSNKQVKSFNTNLYNELKKGYDDGSAIEVFIDQNGTNNIDKSFEDLDDANNYIKDAQTIIGQLKRFFEVGLFEIVKLTVAGFVSDFYNWNVINYSVGEIFSTTLLSDSSIWDKIVKSLIFLVVSFTTLYLIVLIVRMFMGHITIKGILTRFLILAIAAVMPIIIYSPIVDIMFNKPSEKVLGSEMDRMFVLDSWLTRAEKEREEIDKVYPGYADQFNERERQEEYTVKFYTSTDVKNKTNLNYQNGRDISGKKPNPDNMVVVNVSGFHLFEWLSNKETEENLFGYLYSEYPELYTGIEGYEEYIFYDEKDFGGNDVYKLKEPLSASDLLKSLYDNIVKDDDSEDFNSNLFLVTKELLYGKQNPSETGVTDEKYSKKVPYSDEFISNVIFDLSTNSYGKESIYGLGGYSTATKEIEEKTGFILPKEDMLNLEPIIKNLVPFRMDEKSEISSEITNVNTKLIEDYIEKYLSLANILSPDSLEYYTKSERDVLILNTFFIINKEYDIHLYPTTIDTKSLTLDTYIRALFVPTNKFTPDESQLNNIAVYVTMNSELMTYIFFIAMLCSLFLYGLIKFVVLFVLLMPLILATFFYNYVIMENRNSKAWVGAIGILASFALVNIGLLAVWKGAMYVMNASIFDPRGIGISKYPIIMTHSSIIILYIILAFVFVLKPLYRTVKGDFTNLGGTKMAEKTIEIKDRVKSGVSNYMNNLSDFSNPSSRSTESSADDKDNKDKKKKNRGMANELSVENIKSSMEDGSDKDKEDVNKINNKLKGNKVTRKIKGTGKNALSRMFGGDENLSKVSKVASNVASGAKNAATTNYAKAGKDALIGGAVGAGAAIGLNKIGSSLTKGWRNPLKVLKVGRTAERLEQIPDLKTKASLSDSEMKDLEELGLDKEVSDFKDMSNSVYGLDTIDKSHSELISNALRSSGVETSIEDGKVMFDFDKDDSPEARKSLLTPVMENIEADIDNVMSGVPEITETDSTIKANRLSDTSYNFGNDELTPQLMKYVKGKGVEGLNVVENSDGSMKLDFEDAAVAEKVIKDLETKHKTMAKQRNLDMSVNEVRDNSLSAKLIRKDIEKGLLIEGKDVSLQGNNVYAMTDEGKRALERMSGNYSGNVDNHVGGMRELGLDIAQSILGEGDLQMKSVDPETVLSNKNLGKNQYKVTNRDIDLDNLNKLGKQAEKQFAKNPNLGAEESEFHKQLMNAKALDIEWARNDSNELLFKSKNAGQEEAINSLIESYEAFNKTVKAKPAGRGGSGGPVGPGGRGPEGRGPEGGSPRSRGPVGE